MLKRRLVPVLFLKDGWMVRSEAFEIHQYIGDPVIHVERMVQWDVDELIVIDITGGGESFAHNRRDYRHKPVDDLLSFIRRIAVECRIPITFGGRIRTVDDVAKRILNGADKVTVNTALADAPALVGEAARRFGSQAIVASIDYRGVNGAAEVHVDHGRRRVRAGAVEWARRAVELGAGEILLNAIDRDGAASGYDLETVDAVARAVEAPVIACGGAGHQRHFLACYEQTAASAVAAGNIFHFTENAYPRAKAFLKTRLADIR